MIIRLVMAMFLGLLLAGVGYGGWRLLHGPDVATQASGLLAAGEARQARAMLRRALASNDRDGPLHTLLAQADLQLDDPASAEAEVLAARKFRHDAAATSRLLGEALLRQRRYQSLLDALPGIAVRKDQLTVDLAFRSVAFAHLREPEQARETLAQAEQLAPDGRDVLLATARVAALAHDLPRFDQMIGRLLKQMPDDVDALVLNGDVLTGVGEPGEALGALDRAVTASPGSSRARLRRGRLLMTMGEDRRAQADVDAAIDADWRDPVAHLLGAELSLKAGRLAEAQTALQNIDAYADTLPRIAYVEALTALRLQQPAAAAQAVARYLQLMPNDVAGLRLLGQIELQVDRPAAAVERLGAAAAGGVHDAEVFDLLGRAYVMTGRVRDAIGSFRQAQALSPGDREIASHLAAARRLAASASDDPVRLPTAQEQRP